MPYLQLQLGLQEVTCWDDLPDDNPGRTILYMQHKNECPALAVAALFRSAIKQMHLPIIYGIAHGAGCLSHPSMV